MLCWLSFSCLEMRRLLTLGQDQAGRLGKAQFPASLTPREKLFTFHKPYKPLVRNEAEQAALTQHEGLLPLGFRPFRAPRVLPSRGAFSMAMLKPFLARPIVRREGCLASSLRGRRPSHRLARQVRRPFFFRSCDKHLSIFAHRTRCSAELILLSSQRGVP